MVCDSCKKKKATVHLTEIVDGKTAEMHLCEECAKERSLQMEQQFGLADLLAGLSDFGKQVKTEEKTRLQCTNCGLSYEDFRKFGRLGCSECYSAFRGHLSSLLKKIHGSSHHLGKKPVGRPFVKTIGVAKTDTANALKAETIEETLEELKTKLQEAVLAEDFETAAFLRDKIRHLEKKEKS